MVVVVVGVVVVPLKLEIMNLEESLFLLSFKHVVRVVCNNKL